MLRVRVLQILKRLIRLGRVAAADRALEKLLLLEDCDCAVTLDLGGAVELSMLLSGRRAGVLLLLMYDA